jgi:hypothetical protein
LPGRSQQLHDGVRRLVGRDITDERLRHPSRGLPHADLSRSSVLRSPTTPLTAGDLDLVVEIHSTWVREPGRAFDKNAATRSGMRLSPRQALTVSASTSPCLVAAWSQTE